MPTEHFQNSYDEVSVAYDRRYEINPLNGVAKALRSLAVETGARRALDIGCGTGYWLKKLAPNIDSIIGIDLSSGMLRRALDLHDRISLVCGSANSLPFAESSFDLIFVINTLHHINDQRGFIRQARNLLRSGGALATIGMDVPLAIGRWVIYNYFPETLGYDRSRFPLWEQVESWMQQSGLTVQPPRTVEHISSKKRGRAILEDHFIQRHSTSQFMGLTDTQYQAGINRIKSVIAEAESRGEEAVFRTEIQLKMVVGQA